MGGEELLIDDDEEEEIYCLNLMKKCFWEIVKFFFLDKNWMDSFEVELDDNIVVWSKVFF